MGDRHIISEPASSPRDAVPAPRRGARLDAWMAQHPWHPRFLPFAVYGVFLVPIDTMRHAWPPSYPFVYLLQVGLVVYLLWRYRKLLPEVTGRFHWLAAPVGVGVFLAWVWLGIVVSQFDRVRQEGWGTFTVQLLHWMAHPLPGHGYYASPAPESFFATMGNQLGWVAFTLRLLGMAVVVPIFEELFIRSLILRSLSHPRRTAIGIVQILQDLPLIGDWLIHTDLARRAHRHPPVFGPEFTGTPLGRLTFFGVGASTLLFMFSHLPRDWPGAIACALAYCGLLWWTNRPGVAPHRRLGLGPVIWAHGITNALLWLYTLHTGDWQFLGSSTANVARATPLKAGSGMVGQFECCYGWLGGPKLHGSRGREA